MNQFVALAVTEKIATLERFDYLEERSYLVQMQRRGDRPVAPAEITCSEHEPWRKGRSEEFRRNCWLYWTKRQT